MKRNIVLTLLGVFFAGYALYVLLGHFFDKKDVIYLNANDEKAYTELSKLRSALKKEGKRVVLSDKNGFKSGEINLYASSDKNELPKVLDLQAINFLWTDGISERWAPEKLRDFDVVVVKNYPLYSHLKAVNVRTAYIPDIIEMKKNEAPVEAVNKAAYWGDAAGFSLALYLAGKNDFSVDIFGQGFEMLWPKEDIKGKSDELSDFRNYKFVMVDQSEEDIRDEVVNQKIIQIIAGGGVPFVRYNFGVQRLFGNAVVMYVSEENFAEQFNKFMSAAETMAQQRKSLFDVAQQFDGKSCALKFIELFDIMKKKRI